MPEVIRLQLYNADFADPRAVASSAWRQRPELHTQGSCAPSSQAPATSHHDQPRLVFLPQRFWHQRTQVPSAVQVFGKRASRRSIVATASCTALLYIWDCKSNRRFLVDSGAEVSVVPATASDRRSGPVGPVLTGANGSTIQTYGSRTLPLEFNSRHYKWPFTIADVSQPLLGADFLRAYSLLIDVRKRRLVDAEDLTSLTLRPTSAAEPHLGSIVPANNVFARLLAVSQHHHAVFFTSHHQTRRRALHPYARTSTELTRTTTAT